MADPAVSRGFRELTWVPDEIGCTAAGVEQGMGIAGGGARSTLWVKFTAFT